LATFAVGPSTKANCLALWRYLSAKSHKEEDVTSLLSLPSLCTCQRAFSHKPPPALAAVTGSHGALIAPASPQGVAPYTTIGSQHQVFYVDSGEKTQSFFAGQP